MRFHAPDGRLVTAHTDFGGSLRPGVGENVDVLFDPQRPGDVHLITEAPDTSHLLIGVIGWVMIGVAAVVVVAFGESIAFA